MTAPQSKLTGKIFIGHGQSRAWLELSNFLTHRLQLDWIEFNRTAVAGLSTKERLEAMLAESSFAFLVMTAEDEQLDGTIRARENVVHELGLFQGRLGFNRAIVLLEDGCSEFSNIHGLNQIRFPNDNIRAAFEEIRQVLEREQVHSLSDLVTDEIVFDYLPDALTKHGWKPGYKDRPEPAASAYSSPIDAPSPGCLSITTGVPYALDYELPPTVCDGLSFEAKYSDTTMIFIEVRLRSRDGSFVSRKWIKFYISSSGDSGIRAEEGSPSEYTIWWPAKALPNRWVSFEVSLPEVVRLTWGKAGWTYDSLLTFRIRGPLSISPIRFTSHTTRRAAAN